nr:migration and invasion-inhibitory protein isoform X2 [Meriones unguiculatus]
MPKMAETKDPVQLRLLSLELLEQLWAGHDAMCRSVARAASESNLDYSSSGNLNMPLSQETSSETSSSQDRRHMWDLLQSHGSDSGSLDIPPSQETSSETPSSQDRRHMWDLLQSRGRDTFEMFWSGNTNSSVDSLPPATCQHPEPQRDGLWPPSVPLLATEGLKGPMPLAEPKGLGPHKTQVPRSILSQPHKPLKSKVTFSQESCQLPQSKVTFSQESCLLPQSKVTSQESCQLPQSKVTFSQESCLLPQSKVTFSQESYMPESSSWHSRSHLNHDWISGSVDSSSPVASESEAFFSVLQRFREANEEDCVCSSPEAVFPDLQESRSVEEDHECVYCYRINRRLFAVPVDLGTPCRLCGVPRDQQGPETLEEPGQVRVSIPLSILDPPHQYRIHRRKSFDASDTLALPRHCLLGWDILPPKSEKSCVPKSLDLWSSVSCGAQRRQLSATTSPTRLVGSSLGWESIQVGPSLLRWVASALASCPANFDTPCHLLHSNQEVALTPRCRRA